MKVVGIVFIFLCITYNLNGQSLIIQNQHYRNSFSADSTKLNLSVHSGIRPQINMSSSNSRYSATIPIAINGLIYPIVDLNVGHTSYNKSTYDLGVGLGIDYSTKKFTITGKLLPFTQKSGFIADSILKQSNIYPSTGREAADNVFVQGELLAAYRPNRFFTFLGGIGKNSFGEGYRSLLLSDNAASNPFVKMETTFWSIKYVSLFNVWNDFFVNPESRSQDITKLSALHYLSWNITKRINLSIFESVIWQAKDSLTNRFFEPNYMNPFVLYRPVEYAQGSADNVLIGLNLSYKPSDQSTIYSQLILDEFFLKEIRAGNQWWANKFGTQIGIKAKNFMIKNLYTQVEFNLVRPFTYSHKQSPQSYSHANASVTHPVGANFFELNGTISYLFKKHRITSQLVYLVYGSDTSSTSYGQNILKSYSSRDGNYNHSIAQGLKHHVFSWISYYEYPIKAVPNLYITGRYQMRLETISNSFTGRHSFQVGIRSRIWNKYLDF